MRQCLGPKKVVRLRKVLNLPIEHVLVRGNTNHRQDLCLEDGSIVMYWPKTGEMIRDTMRWKDKEEKS